MRYLYIVFMVSILLIYACDESSNSDSVEGEIRCFTPAELFASDCPAEQLTNMCSTLTCGFTIGDTVADGTFPPYKSEDNSCELIDCNTVMCRGTLYTDISSGGNGLSLIFDTSGGESVVMTCHADGFISFDCKDTE